jgi:hypothetical protein
MSWLRRDIPTPVVPSAEIICFRCRGNGFHFVEPSGPAEGFWTCEPFRG